MKFFLKQHFSPLFTITVVFIFIFSIMLFLLIKSPSDFPTHESIKIEEGMSLSEVAKKLEREKIVTNANFFKIVSYLLGLEKEMKSGTYYFNESENTFGVLETISSALYNLPTEKITIYEGEAVYKFADRLEEKLPDFEVRDFENIVENESLEGYLFPDTYLIPLTATAQDIADILNNNFNQRIGEVSTKLASSTQSLDEIIIKASLVENEAGSADYQTKREVAGIIENRLNRGMLLQIDAVFSYIYQRHLPRVLFEHLESDSPYNVYKYTGLPPGPIGNPGMDSIKAVLNPADTDYLYYLTGNDGNFYYAMTNAGHEKNRRNYLNYRN